MWENVGRCGKVCWGVEGSENRCGEVCGRKVRRRGVWGSVWGKKKEVWGSVLGMGEVKRGGRVRKNE